MTTLKPAAFRSGFPPAKYIYSYHRRRRIYRQLENFFRTGEICNMGRTYHFQCTQCSYHADLSGGTDSGLHCDVQTILCRECRELFDVFTRVRRVVGRTEIGGNFSTFLRPEIPPVILRESQFAAKRTAPRRCEWQNFKPACPVSAKHFVETWRHPGRCPRCYAFMEQTGMPFRIWE